ncbi:MAG: hypothetical protein QOG33_1150 [Gaiellales bacterium]|jgi:hypothetical protein|nr:hypothetical protein [Gaiellales bacterium]
MDSLAGYCALVELARRESVLIEAGRWSDLIVLESERQEVLAALPQKAPREARSLLEEAKSIVQRNVAAIVEATDRTREQLAHVGRGRQAIAGYAAGTAASSFVDERR